MKTLLKIHSTRFVIALMAMALVALASVAPAFAQPKRGSGPRVIQLDEFKIEGRVQKPNAFYILNRSNIGYEVLDLRTSFLKDIVRSIQKEPF